MGSGLASLLGSKDKTWPCSESEQCKRLEYQSLGRKSMRVFDEKVLHERIEKISTWKRVAFMILCCERMIPNFEEFSRHEGWGDTKVLRACLDASWAWVSKELVPMDVGLLTEAVELQAPDTEIYRSRFTSAALDAANAVAVTLEALVFPSVDLGVEVATLSRDTVDLFVQQYNDLDSRDVNLEEKIISDRSMQIELACQMDDLDFLGELDLDRDVAEKILRERARKFAKGSLAEYYSGA